MKLIELSQNSRKNGGKYFAMVDDADYDWLNQWKWYVTKSADTRYAHRSGSQHNGKKKHCIPMHRLILGITDPKLKSDHIDRNGLNNQRYNLRKATHAQNMANSKNKPHSSKYRGVCYAKSKAYGKTKREDGSIREWIYYRWVAGISVKGKRMFLGHYKTEEAAVLAWNKAAIKYHGKFAALNKII